MKKTVFSIILVFLFIIFICVLGLKINARKMNIYKQQNSEYEKYLTSSIYGTDVITLINMAISSNEVNNVQKDEKDYYINNNLNSIQINVIMITNEEKKETTTYKMETISKVGIQSFIENFNTTKFLCTDVIYHKETGKIEQIEISQQYE